MRTFNFFENSRGIDSSALDTTSLFAVCLAICLVSVRQDAMAEQNTRLQPCV